MLDYLSMKGGVRMDMSRSVKFHINEDVLPADELKGCVSEFLDLLKDAANDCIAISNGLLL